MVGDLVGDGDIQKFCNFLNVEILHVVHANVHSHAIVLAHVHAQIHSPAHAHLRAIVHAHIHALLDLRPFGAAEGRT